ncbi:protease inhibitor I42 family protein [Methanoregula sp.]|jgi:inhibitor of cysteine peptidase|uniref:protease inhibitor I42 family protein n=1 Tax=Methanoregula sp. TaxID=2052170 RepID=UPI0025D15B9D|nr:protease inhibitor I42 family protein [Methanoregula sp.]
MNFPLTFMGMGILCLAALVVAGCIGTGSQNPSGQTPTLTGTPVMVGHVVATESQNGATVYVNRTTDITLKLKENPTTGYQWNLTVTPGLVITNDTLIPSDTTGKLVGSGGTRVWEINAASTGTQMIHAVYIRSWEPVTGNETAFSMTVIVQ